MPRPGSTAALGIGERTFILNLAANSFITICALHLHVLLMHNSNTGINNLRPDLNPRVRDLNLHDLNPVDPVQIGFTLLIYMVVLKESFQTKFGNLSTVLNTKLQRQLELRNSIMLVKVAQ